MASASERRAAQRALAKAVKEGTTHELFPKGTQKAYKASLKHTARTEARQVLDGKKARPEKGSADGKVLARAASYASRDDDYYDDDYDYSDLEDFWYHEA